LQKKIFLCAINNILSGNCSEDCSFCAQSARYKADIDRYKFKPIEQILKEAKIAKEHGALGYCLVTAGKGLDSNKCENIAQITKAIKKEIPNINIIACNGTATKEQLKVLKDAGVDSYNHNLESSQNYYSKICTTHTWQERYNTVVNAKEVGLKICTGGIFGMGESAKDREELIEAIASLKPDSVAINFYIPNPKLPIKSRNIEYKDALAIIEKISKLLKDSKIMVAGGREHIFKSKEQELEMFKAGCNSIVIGNYLTTKGISAKLDRDRLQELGLSIAKDCNA